MTPGIIQGLESLIGLEVTILNPFDVIEYNSKNISEEMINDIAYRGAVVLGLGMRQIND